MSKYAAEEMTRELEMYWRLTAEAGERERANNRDPELELIYDELDTLSRYTNWPALKQRADAHVRKYAEKRKTRLSLVCASSV
jgi:hypothetical protein